MQSPGLAAPKRKSSSSTEADHDGNHRAKKAKNACGSESNAAFFDWQVDVLQTDNVATKTVEDQKSKHNCQ